jgi:aspartate aminotransferase
VDVRRIVPEDFDAMGFVLHCAREGVVELEGKRYTLLVAPMSGFYDLPPKENPGKTQMRIAYVETLDRLKLVPKLFKELLQGYLERSAKQRPAAAVHR